MAFIQKANNVRPGECLGRCGLMVHFHDKDHAYCDNCWDRIFPAPASKEEEPVTKEPKVSAMMSTKKRVWFPEDVAGEPHPQNPDDGCGGALYKNTTVHLIYMTSDHGPPEKDMSNVLEGKSAHLAHKAERKCADYNDTANLYRDAGTKLPRFGGIDHSDKLAIWQEFEVKYNLLKEPDWSLAGLLWRSLFGRQKRCEE